MHASQGVKPNKHETDNKSFNTSSWAKTGEQNRFNNFEGLKVEHKKFTWSGGEIPYIGRYGGHIWKFLV